MVTRVLLLHYTSSVYPENIFGYTVMTQYIHTLDGGRGLDGRRGGRVEGPFQLLLHI